MEKTFNKIKRKFYIVKVMLTRKLLPSKQNIHPAKGEEKWEAIDTARKNADISIFIETGTYRGDTVEHFKNIFKKIYSIELGHELAEKAKARFSQNENVEIIEGDSAVILPRIINNLNEPALFWLDAHCSEGDTAKTSDYTPIVDELKTILQSPISHVVLIDDARLFDGVNYPTLRKIKKLVRKLRPNYQFTVENDLTLIQEK